MQFKKLQLLLISTISIGLTANSSCALASTRLFSTPNSSKTELELALTKNPLISKSPLNGAITLGPQGLKDSLIVHRKKAFDFILATNINRSDYENITKKLTANHAMTVRSIYTSANIDSQIKLASEKLRLGHRVLILYTENSSHILESMDQNYLPYAMKVQPGDIRSVFRYLRGFDALILVDDKSLYTPKTLSLTILNLYSQNKTAIGYNRKLVEIGALATIYYPVDAIVDEILKWMSEIRFDTDLPKSRHPSEHRTYFNKRVGRSLGIPPTQGSDIYDIRN